MLVMNNDNTGYKTGTIQGFTLLEILVAMLIIATVLVTVFRLHIQTINMTNAARFYTTAALLAEKKMADLDIDKENIKDSSGVFEEQFSEYSWNIKVEDMETELIEGDDDTLNLKKIDLDLSVNNREYVYSVRAYRFVEDD